MLPTAIARAHQHALGMIHSHAPLPDILAYLATSAQAVSGPSTATSILVLDEEGLLRNGASPDLPADYLAAIDRIRPHAELGTCAAAAARGEVVLTPSFLADQKWGELRHLPMSLGYVGAWSMPIKSPRDGRVLGTFGTYYREKREPVVAEYAAVSALAAVAALALEQHEQAHPPSFSRAARESMDAATMRASDRAD
jgi:hypothetical protein